MAHSHAFDATYSANAENRDGGRGAASIRLVKSYREEVDVIRISMYAVLVLALSACGALAKKSVTQPASVNAGSLISSDQSVAGLVAKDLVGVMSQIDVISPARTVLYASRPENQFSERMVIALQDAGYRLRLAQAEQEPRLSYDIEQDLGETSYTVIVTAGLVKVKRRYAVNEAQKMVQPASSIFVLGASVENIELNDSIFANQQPRSLQTNDTQLALATPVPPQKEIVKESLVQEPVVEQGPITTQEPIVNVALKSDLKPATKANMYKTRKSNFEELLEQFNTVRREIMVFPNDSLVMGSGNKQMATEIAANFRAESDVVSIIGCSHGKTALDNGNQKLANGRANRVKDEFILAGIQAELVLHEACWANVHFDEMMPRRGVVVTHKRK
ncbi:MAG: hypothetical protein V3U65_17405 [Granulosicoccaceae bacterium]